MKKNFNKWIENRENRATVEAVVLLERSECETIAGVINPTCPKCKGVGKTRCPTCNGSGFYPLCKNCMGKGCQQCAGEGFVRGAKKCPSCGGKGNYSCEKCQGRGEIGTGVDPNEITEHLLKRMMAIKIKCGNRVALAKWGSTGETKSPDPDSPPTSPRGLDKLVPEQESNSEPIAYKWVPANTTTNIKNIRDYPWTFHWDERNGEKLPENFQQYLDYALLKLLNSKETGNKVAANDIDVAGYPVELLSKGEKIIDVHWRKYANGKDKGRWHPKYWSQLQEKSKIQAPYGGPIDWEPDLKKQYVEMSSLGKYFQSENRPLNDDQIKKILKYVKLIDKNNNPTPEAIKKKFVKVNEKNEALWDEELVVGKIKEQLEKINEKIEADKIKDKIKKVDSVLVAPISSTGIAIKHNVIPAVRRQQISVAPFSPYVKMSYLGKHFQAEELPLIESQVKKLLQYIGLMYKDNPTLMAIDGKFVAGDDESMWNEKLVVDRIKNQLKQINKDNVLGATVATVDLSKRYPAITTGKNLYHCPICNKKVPILGDYKTTAGGVGGVATEVPTLADNDERYGPRLKIAGCNHAFFLGDELSQALKAKYEYIDINEIPFYQDNPANTQSRSVVGEPVIQKTKIPINMDKDFSRIEKPTEPTSQSIIRAANRKDAERISRQIDPKQRGDSEFSNPYGGRPFPGGV